MHSVILLRLLGAVSRERAHQDVKFGHQNYPLTDPDATGVTEGFYGAQATAMKRINDKAIQNGKRTGDFVLLEEVYEALSAGSPTETVTELVQVAAVALLLAEMQVRHHPEAAPGAPIRLPHNNKTDTEGHHRYNGGDRLHGMCRCGKLSGHVVHFCGGHTDTQDQPLEAVQFDGHCSLCHLPMDPAARTSRTVTMEELGEWKRKGLEEVALQIGDGNTQTNTFG